jgi:hypothetical protein
VPTPAHNAAQRSRSRARARVAWRGEALEKALDIGAGKTPHLIGQGSGGSGGGGPVPAPQEDGTPLRRQPACLRLNLAASCFLLLRLLLLLCYLLSSCIRRTPRHAAQAAPFTFRYAALVHLALVQDYQ